MAKPSPTSRSLAHCRSLKWDADVVERFIPQVRIRKDLFGFADIVALNGRITAIQATSGANHSARVCKILATPAARDWLKCGGAVEVWSWAKKGPRGGRKTWQLRVEPVTLEMFEESTVAAG